MHGDGGLDARRGRSVRSLTARARRLGRARGRSVHERQQRGLAVGRAGRPSGTLYRLERRDGHDDPAADRAGAASPSPLRARRVDLAMPTFSDPTNITNPLFPVSSQDSVLMLGHVDGKPFRTEVTLLPETQIIEWEGRRVETLVSQYNAFLDGAHPGGRVRLLRAGGRRSVWYFGEDVSRLHRRLHRRDRGHVEGRQGRARRDDHAGRSAGR